jgi:DNA-binding transcriptional LysR family regulator
MRLIWSACCKHRVSKGRPHPGMQRCAAGKLWVCGEQLYRVGGSLGKCKATAAAYPWYSVGSPLQVHAVSLRLDLQTLQLFASVARWQSIARAAEHEHIAPSALSKRISELEADLSTVLLYRLRRGVELTPAGTALLHHANAIFNQVERLQSDMAEYAQGVRGHVRMMANLTSIVHFLTHDLSTFAAAQPQIKIDLRESSTPAILKATADGLIDFGVVADVRVRPTEQFAPGLTVEDYRPERMVIVVPAGHPLSGRESVELAEALEYDFIGLHMHGGWDTLMRNASGVAGRPLRIRIRVPSYDAMIRLVQAGLGITVAPQAAVSQAQEGVVAVRLAEVWADRMLQICYRHFDLLPVTARLLIEHLRPVGPP